MSEQQLNPHTSCFRKEKKNHWHFAGEGEETYVGRDFSRFSLSSNVTRLAKLQKEELNKKRGWSWQISKTEWGRKKRRHRLFCQMASLFIDSAWHGEGSLPSVWAEQWPRAHRPPVSATGQYYYHILWLQYSSLCIRITFLLSNLSKLGGLTN